MASAAPAVLRKLRREMVTVYEERNLGYSWSAKQPTCGEEFGLKIPEPGKISTSSFLQTFVDSARALSPRPLNSFANALRLNLRRSSG